MSLLTPAFLAGLALLAVPVLVHLTQRRRSDVTPFPSLMFLRRVPFRTRSRRRIRDPLLFAARCLAVALLALAFARPLLPGAGAGAGRAEARDLVVLLDASGSMGHGDRWERARAAVGEALDGLAEGDRAALVAFSDRARELVSLTDDVAALRRALEAARRDDRTTRFDAAVRAARRILDASDRGRREVMLVSDFQRTGRGDAAPTRLPGGVRLIPVDLSGGGAPNRAVAHLDFHPEGAGRLRLVARVANLGDAPVEGLGVTLELGGNPVATRAVDVPARGAATATFGGVALPEGRTRGEVRIDGDGLASDDALRFVVAPDEGLDVLLVGRPGGGERDLFLQRALSIGDRPPVRSARRAPSGVDAAALREASVVVWNDAGAPSGAATAALAEWVAAGGGLIVALGPSDDASAWAAGGADLLGGRPTGTRDRAGRGGERLAWLDYDHPALELFSAPRSGDFSAARFFRFHGLEPADGTDVVARFEGGEPALLERASGEGRVLVWASTLDRYWNDLALQPVYLPFVHRLVRHAAGWREPERWVTVGEAVDLAAAVPGEATGEWLLVGPDGGRRRVEPSNGPAWHQADRAGFHELRPVEGEGARRTIAVNAALEESDLSAVAPEVLAADVGAPADGGGEAGTPAAAAAGAGGGGARAGEGPSGAEIWWPLVAAAALLLVAEAWAANRRGRVGAVAPARRTPGAEAHHEWTGRRRAG